MDPAGYRMTNLFILLLSIPLAAAASFLLARTWLTPYQSAFTALSATVLWALNPLLTNGVTYIVQRMTSLNALFCLASLVCFLVGLRTTNRLWYIGSTVAFLLALSVKEIALLLPLVGWLYLWTTAPTGSRSRRWLGGALAAAVVLSQVALLWIYTDHSSWQIRPFTLSERLLTQGRVVCYYQSLFLAPLPSRMNLDYDFLLSTSLLSPPTTFPALLFHVLLICVAVGLNRTRPLFSFGVLSFYLLQLLESTVLPLEIIFEHRAYLPSLFLALAVTDLLTWLFQSLKFRHTTELVLALSIVIGTWWGMLNYQRNSTWKDPVTLWEDIVAKAPRNDRALYNLGNAYKNTHRYQEALKAYKEALRINPLYAFAYNNIGLIYFELGLFPDATTMFRRAIDSEWQDPLFRFNLGLSYVRLGQKELALEQWRFLRMVDPELAEKLYIEIFP